jgi:hypothetical protein
MKIKLVSILQKSIILIVEHIKIVSISKKSFCRVKYGWYHCCCILKATFLFKFMLFYPIPLGTKFYNVLQCFTMFCNDFYNVLQCFTMFCNDFTMFCNVFQCAAMIFTMFCNILQCSAKFYYVYVLYVL